MGTLLGIDEAGRGPVIGPLVVAGFLIKTKNLPALNKLGLKSSKLLSFQKRQELTEAILSLAQECEIQKIQPPVLDQTSLNQLTARSSAKLINLLKPTQVILDAPAFGQGVENYRRLVKKLCGTRCQIIAKNKADETEPVVSAASIIAKYYRDAEIRVLHKTYGDFGSGYAHDLKTRQFLQKYFDEHHCFPKNLVRHKWSTIQKILKTS